jgi:cobalamin biosynthesis Mg chelatase CobN
MVIPITGTAAGMVIPITGTAAGARITVAGIAVGAKTSEVAATGVAAITTPVGLQRVLADRAAEAAVAEVVTTAAVPARTLTASSAGLAHTAVIGSLRLAAQEFLPSTREASAAELRVFHGCLISPLPVDDVVQRSALPIGTKIVAEDIDTAVMVFVAGV